MTQEEKNLLLQDLCARLPYEPKVRYHYCSMGSVAINGYSDEGYLSYQNLEDFSIYPKYGLEKRRVCNIMPYLRPMSSMTKEEREQTRDLWIDADIKTHATRLIDFYNKNHLDYRGLIAMGLALPATERMYK